VWQQKLLRPETKAMTPILFPEANIVMKAPTNMPNCVDVHAFRDGMQVITAWRPSPEELVKINMGEPVFLRLIGPTMQPAEVTADCPFQRE
jgi:hypothetical protein